MKDLTGATNHPTSNKNINVMTTLKNVHKDNKYRDTKNIKTNFRNQIRAI